MSFHIGSHIVRGELLNTRRNGVWGWIDFGGDWGVRVELTGNFSGELAGKHIRFQATRAAATEDCPRSDLDLLADSQSGVVGEMRLHSLPGEPVRLSLEWFSQNGRVVAELIDPVIEYGPEEKSADEDEQQESFAEHFEQDALDFLNPQNSDSDPYQLFPADLEAQLQESSNDGAQTAGESVEAMPDDGPDEMLANLDNPQPRQERPWDEVIPGLDPETKRMYDEWDEVIHGTKDVPFMSLFDPPLTLPRPQDIASEEEAAEALKTLLARLALHCVVIHMCEHFTALQTYAWLMEDLLPEEGVHPCLGPTGFVRHYDTGEHCPACDAEFEAKWNEKRDDP